MASPLLLNVRCVTLYGVLQRFSVLRQSYLSRTKVLGQYTHQVALVGKNTPASAGAGRDTGFICRWGRCPGGGHGNPLQYSCLETPHQQEEPGGLQPMGPQTAGHN